MKSESSGGPGGRGFRLIAAYTLGIIYAAVLCITIAWMISAAVSSSHWNDGRCLIEEVCNPLPGGGTNGG